MKEQEKKAKEEKGQIQQKENNKIRSGSKSILENFRIQLHLVLKRK